MKKTIKNKKLLFLLLCSSGNFAAAEMAAKNYVDCLSEITKSKNEDVAGMAGLGDANSFTQKLLTKVMAQMPQGFEKELARLTGASARDIQSLKTRAGDGALMFDKDQNLDLTQKLNLVSKTFYELKPHDERFFVIVTPEGKVLQTQISDKAPATKKVSLKFTVKDDLRQYRFSINLDNQCKKNCDNHFWLVDVASLDKDEKASTKKENFPDRAVTVLDKAEALTVSRTLMHDEVKYAVSRIVGVEKSQTLPGEFILPDPSDTASYDRSRVVVAFKACEKSLASSEPDAELLSKATELLR